MKQKTSNSALVGAILANFSCPVPTQDLTSISSGLPKGMGGRSGALPGSAFRWVVALIALLSPGAVSNAQTGYMTGAYNVYRMAGTVYEPANIFVDTFNAPYNTIYACDNNQKYISRFLPAPATSVGGITGSLTQYTYTNPGSSQGACAIDHNLDLFIFTKVAPTATSTDSVNLYYIRNNGTVANPSYPTNAAGTTFGTTGAYGTAVTLGGGGGISSFGTTAIATYGAVDGTGNLATVLNFQITAGTVVQGGVLLESPSAGIGSSYAAPTEQILGAYGTGSTAGQQFLNCGAVGCSGGPNNVQFDSNNNLYVSTSSTNHAIMKGVPMTATAAATSCPTIASTQYYVGGGIVNGTSLGYCVTKLGATSTLPGTSTAPASYSAATDSNGNVYIATNSNNVVLKESPTSTPGTYTQSVLLSYPGSTTAITAAIPGYFQPSALAIDGSGNLSITEGASTNDYGLQMLNVGPVNFGTVPVGSTVGQWISFTFNATSTLGATPVVVTTQGGGTDFAWPSGSQTTPAANPGYWLPVCSAAATYTVGTISASTTQAYTCIAYVTFTPSAAGVRNGAVQLVGAAGTTTGGTTVLATGYISGTGTAAHALFTPGTETLVAAGTATAPRALAVDAAGNVYAPLTGGSTLTKYVAGGGATASIGSGFVAPKAAAVDAVGNVYVVDSSNNHVYLETLSGTTYTQTIVATSALNGPSAIAVDAAGSIYIADTGNSRVIKETPQGLAYAETTVASGLSSPQGVAVDASGNVYIAQANSNVVTVEQASNVYSPTYTPLTLTTSTLSTPTALAVDAFGSLYITDTGNSRILKETAPATGTPTSESTITTSGLSGPLGIAVQPSGNVYISDSSHSRILEENLTSPSLVFSGSTLTQTENLTNVGSAALNIPDAISPAMTNPSLSAGFTLGSGGSVCPSTTTSSSAGTLAVGATCTLPITFGGSGTVAASLVLTDNSDSSTSTASQTIKLSANPAPSALNFSLPSTVVTGNAINVTVTAQYTGGVTDTGYTGTVSFLSSDGAATLPASYTFKTSDAGVHTFSVTLNTLGSQSVSAVDTSNSLSTAQSTTVITNQQTITFPAPTATVQFGASAPLALNATATSGLVISYTTSGPGVVVGTTFYPTGPGSVVINANQSGGNGYLAATPISQTVNVTPPAAASAGTSLLALNSSNTSTVTLTFNASFTLGSLVVNNYGPNSNTFALASGGTCNVGSTYSAGGSCTVDLTYRPGGPGIAIGVVQAFDSSASLLPQGAANIVSVRYR